MTARFCAIGECMIEISGTDAAGYQLGFAGDTFNTAWYVRSLLPESNEVSYFTAFGDDPFSHRQRTFFETHGIDVGGCPVIAGRHPGLYAITLDAEGERAFTYWRTESAARLLADRPSLLRRSIERSEYVYFSGITLAILDNRGRKSLLREIAEAKTGGGKVMFDPNFRPALWESLEDARMTIGNAERISDIVLTTFDDEVLLHGEASVDATIRRLREQEIQEFVIKRGRQPAILFSNDTLRELPARDGINVVDTTGAGDSFNGTYIAARIGGKTPCEAVLRAHAMASRVVSEYGALISMERLQREHV